MKQRQKKLSSDAGAKRKSAKKKIVITVVALAAVAAVVVIMVTGRPAKAPDPTRMEHAEALKYAASAEFASLPAAERVSYFDRMRQAAEANNTNPRELMRNNNLSEKERQQLRENMGVVWQARMEEQAKKLLAMTQEERQREYDRMAAEWQKRRDERAARGGQQAGDRPQRQPGQAQGEGGRQRGGGGPNIARMLQRYEGTSSDTRAIMAEMRMEMRKRMQQNR